MIKIKKSVNSLLDTDRDMIRDAILNPKAFNSHQWRKIRNLVPRDAFEPRTSGEGYFFYQPSLRLLVVLDML